MGQAKKRGSFEQRRQQAIARDYPGLHPDVLNSLYQNLPDFSKADREVLKAQYRRATALEKRFQQRLADFDTAPEPKIEVPRSAGERTYRRKPLPLAAVAPVVAATHAP